MAEVHTAKRARANTAGDDHVDRNGNGASVSRHGQAGVDTQKIQKLVQHLDRETLSTIVIKAAVSHADVSAMVENAAQKIHEKEQSRVVDFDYYSKSIWKSINVTYRSMNGSKQYDIAFDVANDVTNTIKSIVKQCGPFANPKTRLNGLSVLRKIGKTIALSSNDTLGNEVQKQFQYDSSLEDGMFKIVSSMKPEERQTIRQDERSEEALWPKLHELQELGADYCIFGGLGKVLDLLDGGEGEGGEYEEYEGEDEDEDQDEGEEYEDGDDGEDYDDDG